MKFTVDQTILNKNNLTLEEFLVLFLNANNVDIKSISQSLLAKGLVDKDLYSTNLIVSNRVKDLISTVIIDSDKNVINNDEEYINLALKLKELYPSGVKLGTNYQWRGSTAEVAKKLKTLVVKYNFVLNSKDAIQATKKYVESFNGNYKYMSLLKYFILKTSKDADGNTEIKSELMSIIENKNQIDSQREDWVSTLV